MEVLYFEGVLLGDIAYNYCYIQKQGVIDSVKLDVILPYRFCSYNKSYLMKPGLGEAIGLQYLTQIKAYSRLRFLFFIKQETTMAVDLDLPA